MATPINSHDAPPPVGPYSHAIKTAHGIYCSGQIHMNVEGKLIDGSIAEKTAQCIRNLKAVLEAADSSLDKVVKTTIFLSDMAHFEACTGISKPISTPHSCSFGYYLDEGGDPDYRS
ncbi:related to BRT1 protein, down-regulated by mating factor B [Cephalotrichum gorgonifer]|uniref:Related to BRT1 protein, down-regulated by mating factor B n=1 Tax=Cephalotrichum gorgonifer TaxID=2041049 RepID=A0AAE8MVM6_9PEZI|nr:related to BRT1 protein, down-regulated by mating factor B [Cephalotrichum gorgonifer]